MNRMQTWLARAATELSVRVIVGHIVTLSNGRRLSAEVFFPDLGRSLGTLVFDSNFPLDEVARQEIVEQGYGVSSFSEPLPNEEFDIADYAEMFLDWGWSGSDIHRPSWMSL